MARVITNAGQSFDDGRDAGQSPEIRAVSVSPRSLAQGPLNMAPLAPAQSWLPAGSAGASQRRGPALIPFFVPPTDALAAHLEAPSNGGQDELARCKKTSGAFSPLLQSLEISPCTILSMHTISIYSFSGNVTILCEVH
jgi:hypothetical protein